MFCPVITAKAHLAFGSVKHEGPSTSKRQIGEICQALYTEAFTSFCQTYDGAMCSDFPGTIAFCLHMVWRMALVSSAPCLYARLHLRPSPRSFPFLGLALRPSRSCLSMPPGNLCHAGGWHLCKKPARGTCLRSLFHCGIVSFRHFR